MAEFVWGTDYRQYLQDQAYVNDIRDAQRGAARDTIAAIGASSRSILLGVEAGMGHIADAQREAAQLTADAEWGAAQLTADSQREAAQLIVGATEHWTYPEGAVADPVGPAVGVNEMRVNRGGHFHSEAKGAQAGERFVGNPGNRYSFFGFRPVKSCPLTLLHRHIER